MTDTLRVFEQLQSDYHKNDNSRLSESTKPRHAPYIILDCLGIVSAFSDLRDVLNVLSKLSTRTFKLLRHLSSNGHRRLLKLTLNSDYLHDR